MNNLSLRLYILLTTLIMWIQAHAQSDDEDNQDFFGRGKGDNNLDEMEDLMEGGSFHISFSDILAVIGIIVLCYFFNKIWRGCTYLIILVAGFFYFMLH